MQYWLLLSVFCLLCFMRNIKMWLTSLSLPCDDGGLEAGQWVLMLEFKFLTQNWFLGHKQPTAWVTRMTVRKSLSCLRTSTPGDSSRAPQTQLTWAWCRVWPRVTKSCYDSTFSSLPFYNQDWGWAKVISGFMIGDNFPF